MTPSGGSDMDPAEVAQSWAIMQAAESAVSSDELAVIAIYEAMRLMLVSGQPDLESRAKDGIRALIGGFIEGSRERDPDELARLVESWRSTAESLGLDL